MARITSVRWQLLECVFLKAGFSFERQAGGPRSYVKGVVHRPVIIPTYKEIDVEAIKSNLKTAGRSRDDDFEFLELCR